MRVGKFYVILRDHNKDAIAILRIEQTAGKNRGRWLSRFVRDTFPDIISYSLWPITESEVETYIEMGVFDGVHVIRTPPNTQPAYGRRWTAS